MASAPEVGLELPIGVTDQKAIQSVVRMVGRIEQEARKAEQAAVKANQGITRSFTTMSNQSRAQIQNVSYQLQDVFVQIAGGTSAARALSQQMPQMLGGFGALGAVLGTVSAVAIPLAAHFLSLEGGSEDLAKATDNATKALEAWRQASNDASLSAQELAEKYGEAASAARALLTGIAEVSEAKAMVAQKEAVDKLVTSFDDLNNRVTAYQNVLASGDNAGAMGWVIDIEERFGIAIEQAVRLNEIIRELNGTSDASARNTLFAEMADILRDAAEHGSSLDGELLNTVESALRTADAVLQIDAAAAGAAGQMEGLAAAARGAAAAASSAAAAMGAAGIFVGNDGSIQRTGRKDDPSTAWRFQGPPDPNRETLKTRRAREAAEEAREQERLAKLLAGGSSGGGGRKRSGSRSRAASKPEPSLFENAERDLLGLQRQIELLGRSSEEAATAKARWELLDEAKKRGITVNETLNAQIEAQAAQVGRLTGELERAEISQDQFETAIDGVADAMAGALIAGESLREGLAQVFKQIASDILNSGIRNALSSVFNPQAAAGGGGFGAVLSSLFGGFRAAGGPVDAGRAYVVGERGPEIIVPRDAGQVIPNHKLGGGRQTVHLTVDVRGATGNAEVRQMVAQGVQQGMAQVRREVPAIMADRQKRGPD